MSGYLRISIPSRKPLDGRKVWHWRDNPNIARATLGHEANTLFHKHTVHWCLCRRKRTAQDEDAFAISRCDRICGRFRRRPLHHEYAPNYYWQPVESQPASGRQGIDDTSRESGARGVAQTVTALRLGPGIGLPGHTGFLSCGYEHVSAQKSKARTACRAV